MLSTIFLFPGWTSVKFSFLKSSRQEDSDKKKYTFTYLRLFTFTLESIQSKIVAKSEKVKFSKKKVVFKTKYCNLE